MLNTWHRQHSYLDKTEHDFKPYQMLLVVVGALQSWRKCAWNMEHLKISNIITSNTVAMQMGEIYTEILRLT